ncbi:hypothetical protein WJX79_006380 [Trebouxia sp. C0005]
MTLRSYSNTSPVRCGENRWTIPNLANTRSWAAKHFRGVLGTWDHHKARASLWQPAPYQWAPLTERAQELPSEALERKDFGKFVQFFRQASPYIEGHRGRTFVVVIPGEVILHRHLLQTLLEDIQLLHELGCRLVVVLGAKTQIDNYLSMRGLEPKNVKGYRITDEDAMLAAMEAAGTSRMLVEAQLSKAPAVSVIRRHTRSSNTSDEFHFAPALRVVSGNYVTSKRRGVVDGVDFGSTGSVRFVQHEAIHQQLDLGHLVLLSNLGYSASGEVLNCNTFDVATHAAIELKADKIIGVKRAHLVDARQDGGLLLELYSRDGVGTMISTDFYEGIRPAQQVDLDSIEGLLRPLAQAGVTKARSRESLMHDLHSFTVLERESEVLACVLLQDLGWSADGTKCGELAAFCVHPSHRGSGRGDSLLDYVEQSARTRGIQRLVLLTTRTADWFMQRDFKSAGCAHESHVLPESRRQAIDPARNSQLYCKEIVALNDTVQAAPAGKRIGF